jgi:hypothetical protein
MIREVKKLYDPRTHIVEYGGVPLCRFTSRKIKATATAVCYSHMNADMSITTRLVRWTCELWLDLRPDSPSNARLATILHEDSCTGGGIHTLFIKDNSGAVVLGSRAAWVHADPPPGYRWRLVGTLEIWDRESAGKLR